jgi:hypothetical protein
MLMFRRVDTGLLPTPRNIPGPAALAATATQKYEHVCGLQDFTSHLPTFRLTYK